MQGMMEKRADLARTTLGVLFIGGLTVASLWILQPFLGAFIWATMVVVATWPLLRSVELHLGGRRGLAVTVMTLVVMLVFLLPVIAAIGLIAKYADDAARWAMHIVQQPLPQPPGWLGGLPLVGPRAVDAWLEITASGAPALAERLQPYAQSVTRWIVAEAGTLGMLFVQCALIVVLSAVLYSGGERWGAWMVAFGRRLADERGEEAIVLAGKAIRGVALGVVGTAIVQTALAGIGLAIAGVPFAGALTALIFVLCLAQLGPLLVLLSATAWLFAAGVTGWATFLLVWSLVVGVMDNFLRPLLIRRGADLPLLLIFAGVIGGLFGFGLVGLFVGPVVLAVTFTLLDAWVEGRESPERSAP